jgi:hypothetical protein
MAKIRKACLAQLLIFLIVSHTLIDNINYHSQTMATFKVGMNPGILLRVEQSTIDSL